MSLTNPAHLVDSDFASRPRVTADAAPQPYDPGDCESVWAQFLLSPDLVHLSNFYLASNPTPIRDAITFPHSFLDDNMFAREEDKLWRTVCAEAAEYVGGHADEIALTTRCRRTRERGSGKIFVAGDHHGDTVTR
ncbi:hypothetical protein [Streptomyces similanensis]|uniref:Uncharacterized protein n=1 Tax=Streptomyces similanensis TaxID=1274988 RepID=A0ABP9KN33_9ACTN